MTYRLTILAPPFIIVGMGCGERYFTNYVGQWIKERWLPLGGKIIDFGSQEFTQDLTRTRYDVRRFLNGIDGAIEPPEFTVRAIFRAAGFEYVSLDVDGQRDSQYFDLNCFAVPGEYLGQFDFVNNQGTIEHLANPINGFHAAHDLVKVWGVIRHAMPLNRWIRHGFFHPTAKFYDQLIRANHYELLQSRVIIRSVDDAFSDGFFKEVVDETGGKKATFTDAVLHVVYRKTSDRAFEIPTDHLHELPAETADKIARNLSESYRELVRHRRVP